MANMNYSVFVVKIIKNPEQSFFKDGTSVTEFPVQLSQIRKNNIEIILQVSAWGKLGYDIMDYYKINDYIIIEGYISLRTNNYDDFSSLLNKQVEISVSKIYPLFLKK